MKLIKWQQLCSFITCILMILAIAINRDQRILGYELNSATSDRPLQTLKTMSDGSQMLNTAALAASVKGYGGPTPLNIYFHNGIITRIQAQKNAETPDFFEQVTSSILPSLEGKEISMLTQHHFDAVSGATLSSLAVIANLRAAGAFISSQPATQNNGFAQTFISWRFIFGLLVVIGAGILPFFVKWKHYRIVQLSANVVILGLWSGTFISYSMMVNYMSSGINWLTAILPVVLLSTAFIYPLFNRKNHYCTWICPLGSLQELAGRCHSGKIRLSQKSISRLNYLRITLWSVLMILAWSGIWCEWMNYELFTVFLFSQASPAITAAGILFLGLSFFINRPYCRFVCPTGMLIKVSQYSNNQ